MRRAARCRRGGMKADVDVTFIAQICRGAHAAPCRLVLAGAVLAAAFAGPASAAGDPGQCSAYAKGAVAQNDEALRRKCGFGGARWQSNYDAHYGWCMVDGWMFNGTQHENQARAEALSKCQPKPDAASGAKPATATGPGVITQIREWTKVAREMASNDENVWGRYGNWMGQGWWGGSENPDRPGMLPPVDDLDATAQKHDMGYQIAEELGRGREGVKESYMLVADLIAIRDSLALDKNPSRWTHPAKDPAKAQMYRNRLIIIFETLQTKKNYLKSIPLKREDIADLETLNRILDGLPNVAQFEQAQMQRVRQWRQQYDEFQKRKSRSFAPTNTPR